MRGRCYSYAGSVTGTVAGVTHAGAGGCMNSLKMSDARTV